MGSSKKHKSDREHKHKHRHRSRSRSRSKERHQGKKRREKDEKSKLHVSSRVEIDVPDRTVTDTNLEPVPAVSGDSSTLSIEDTNKIRLKLGLKPLDVSGKPAASSAVASTTKEDTEDAPKKKEDVHVPAINIGQIKKTAKLREKMENQRQKRQISEKLNKIKTLGESDDDDDLSQWLEKSRRIERERQLAEKTAKMLDQMDQDFGIGSLVEEEFSRDKKKKEYTSRDLQGIKVEHNVDSFKEGRSVILTLKDHGILDEDAEEVLVNYNIGAEETAARLEEARKKKLKDDYQPYDDDEFTEERGLRKPKTVLGKYDEEISGPKMKSFQLGASGKYIPSAEKELERMRSELKQQEHILNQTSVLAKEFYTAEEMEEAKFKKVKKIKRKIRKKTVLKADDLLPLADETTSHFGSRLNRVKESGSNENGDVEEVKIEQQDDTEPMEIDPPQFEESKILTGIDDDDDVYYNGGTFEEDEAMNELHATLDKVRKLKQKKLVHVKDAIENTLNHAKYQNQNMNPSSAVNIKGSDIVLNSTSEFCRALGDIPTYGLAGNRDEERSAFLDLELELMERKKKIQDEEDMSSQWNEVDIDTKPVNIIKEENSVLDEEPSINMGLSAALQVAHKKGYLENVVKRQPSGPKHSDLEAIHYSIEDKRYDDLDEKYRKRDRYTGMLMDFKEKEGYKPDVRLEYADDSGRLLNEKEAFRQLSHRFHGKGPGKKKTEKRMKKLEEEQLMKQMSSTDTPLNTLTLLQEKQKQERTPYVILSGNKGMSANTIVK